MTWLRSKKKRRCDDTMTPVTPTTEHEEPCLRELDRHDPAVRALTAASDGKPLPPIPVRARG